MHWYSRLAAAFGLACVLASFPVAAGAATTLLGFCGQYTNTDGLTATHRGLDVAGTAGDPIASPRAGRVKFAGDVPGTAGESVTAVTVETADGLLTLMPLERAVVRAGEDVDAGDIIGSLAVGGDASSAETHLHMSLRVSGVYADPAAILAPASISSQPSDAETAEVPRTQGVQPVQIVAVQSPLPVAAPSRGPAVVVGGSATEVSEVADVSVPQHDVSQVPDARPLRAPASAILRAAEVSGEMADTPSMVTPGHGSALPAASSAAPQQRAAQAARSRPTPVIAIVSVCVAIVAFAAIYAGTRKAFSVRVSNPPVSDRLGTMLQHLIAGDTICGLTSCPGPLPSQSRGRIAQGR